jgi:ribulose-phosphate 3-epimerase
VIKALRPHVAIPFDVHLMIAPADPFLEAFREAGADHILVHPEAGPHLDRTLRRIRELGARPGVVLNPATPPESIEWALDEIDQILVMSVNPGFGGQSFITGQLRKIAALRALIDATGRDIVLEVDGGVDAVTARQCVEAGATALVAGSAVFKDGPARYAANIAALRGG